MTHEEIKALSAIDVHSHFGPVHSPVTGDRIQNGTEEYLIRTMALSKIAVSINSSRYAIMPRGSGYTVEGNNQILAAAEALEGVYVWATVDPHQPETFLQAEEMLQHPKVLGVKIHPEEHEYDLKAYGDPLFAFAAKLHVPLLGHSGAPCCMPETYGFFADRYPEIPVIAAHLGCGSDGDSAHHIRAIMQNGAGNLFTDTSSIQSLLSNLLEYAVGQMGADRILFGTDSSNYFSPCQRLRVEEADIAEEDKYKILQGNALRLFPRLRHRL
ncbi:MAG: amidohydrolase family protein [Oscillospiraceae bacterium]|nr:amidohydrolase family protein [Oscillospiraceae bacterium]